MKLDDFDANLYRLYAVGLLAYDEALGQAHSLWHLRRAMLAFDQNAQAKLDLAGLAVGGDAQPDSAHGQCPQLLG